MYDTPFLFFVFFDKLHMHLVVLETAISPLVLLSWKEEVPIKL